MHSIKLLLLSGAFQLARAQVLTTGLPDPTSVLQPRLTVHRSGLPVPTTHEAQLPSTTDLLPLPHDLDNATAGPVNSTDCTPRPHGYGPLPYNNDRVGFEEDQDFREIALNASTPKGYARAFDAQVGSVIGSTYLGYSELESYDTKNCSAQCDKIDKCKAINIYFERTPTLYLAEECQDAPAMTVIKCAFWGEKVSDLVVINSGRKDWKFEIVIAASNGYNKKRSGTSGASG